MSDLPVDNDHAMLVGSLMGMVMRARAEGFDYEVEMLDDEQGNHLAMFEVTTPSGRYRVRVEKVV